MSALMAAAKRYKSAVLEHEKAQAENHAWDWKAMRSHEMADAITELLSTALTTEFEE